MFSYIKPSLFILTFATAFAVVLHDTHIDRMATAAIGLPLAAASYGVAESLLKKTDHTHVERAEFQKNTSTSVSRSAPPKIQPRDDDRRYIQNKKFVFTGGGYSGLWPSV